MRRERKRFQQTLDVVVVLVVDFFDASIAKRKFAHPVNSSSDGRWNPQSWLPSLAKAVVFKIVSTQILTRVVGSDVVHVHLITILKESGGAVSRGRGRRGD